MHCSMECSDATDTGKPGLCVRVGCFTLVNTYCRTLTLKSPHSTLPTQASVLPVTFLRAALLVLAASPVLRLEKSGCNDGSNRAARSWFISAASADGLSGLLMSHTAREDGIAARLWQELQLC